MGELVVKDNALISASYSLGLVEQRLLLLAIVTVRQHDHDNELDFRLGKPITITAQSYVDTFGVTRQAAYMNLKEACDNIFDRQFSYQKREEDGSVSYHRSRWVSETSYNPDTASVEFTFAPSVLPLITQLEARLTQYEIEQVAELNSGYAVRLYELLIQWRDKLKTPMIKLAKLRDMLGVKGNEYQRMYDFKRFVLDYSIDQINQHTDITAKYQQKKRGRSIEGFTFTFRLKEKPDQPEGKSRDENTPDMFAPFKMTEKQRLVFASKLSKLPELSDRAKGSAGRSYDAFAQQIADELLVDEHKAFYKPYLEKVGFKVGFKS